MEWVFFGLFFKLTHVSTIFMISEKKVLDPNEPFIITFQTILRNTCLLVILEFCLMSVVVYSVSAAYTNLWWGLKYLLKVPFIIQNYPNMVGFLIFKTLCDIALYLKKYQKNDRHLCLVWYNFTKLSQNMCLINANILIYQYARLDSKLWNIPWFYCISWVFS